MGYTVDESVVELTAAVKSEREEFLEVERFGEVDECDAVFFLPG